MKQEELRKKVRMLKAMQNVSYKELSGYIDIKESSMYNWLRQQYSLSPEKEQLLAEVISTLKE